MIKKIIASAILLCLFIAIPLYVLGFEKVTLGAPFLAFMKNCSRELNDFAIAIPDIPQISKFEAPAGIFVVINFMIDLVNGLSSFINFVILMCNQIIQLLQFIFIIVKNLITFKDTITAAPVVDWNYAIAFSI